MIEQNSHDTVYLVSSTVQYIERSLLLLVIAASDLALRSTKLRSVFGVV